jgi:hypothetical protein
MSTNIRTSDPRVLEILARFDAVATDSLRDDSMLSSYVEQVCGFDWLGWSDAAMRAVLLAYLINAPDDDDVDTMLAESRRYEEWLEEFRLQNEYEEATGLSCYGAEFPGWKQARLAATEVQS